MQESSISWQKILAQGFSCASELLEFLKLPKNLSHLTAETQFKTRVPRGFAARMVIGDPHDPLLLQVLASPEELTVQSGYTKDPLAEMQNNPIPGLIHKYHGRVLLTVTGSCAINCRFCFRRHFSYEQNNPGRQGWQAAFDYIKGNQAIHEVILSGGDPLLANDDLLSFLLNQLALIPHVQTVRFHTRIPVVLPERITSTFIECLHNSPLKKVMVLHVNHPQELDERVEKACQLLKAHCHLLNQSVLLAGINDDLDCLITLSNKLFSMNVLPYYLHLLDKVQGASHFEVPLPRALLLFQQLQHHLPGYLVPRLVREEPHRKSKTLYAVSS